MIEKSSMNMTSYLTKAPLTGSDSARKVQTTTMIWIIARQENLNNILIFYAIGYLSH